MSMHDNNRIFSSEELANLSDRELINALKFQRGLAIRARNSGNNSRRYEVECCYIQRELDLRNRSPQTKQTFKHN